MVLWTLYTVAKTTGTRGAGKPVAATGGIVGDVLELALCGALYLACDRARLAVLWGRITGR